MIKTNLREEAARIMDLLEKDFTFEDGSLFLEKSSAGGIFPHHIYADLGDFIPFFLYFGRKDFVYKQLNHYKKSLSKDGLLISEHKTFGISGLAKSYEYTDLLLGLMDLYDVDKTEENRKILVETTQLTIKTFRLDGNPSSFNLKGLHLPIFDTRDSTFIEIFCDLAELLKDDYYLTVAENIYEKMVSIPFFSRYGLLPNFATNKYAYKILSKTKLGEKFNRAIYQKNNTNSLFAFHASAKAGNKEAYLFIDKILDTTKYLMSKNNGRIPFEFIPGKFSYESSSLPSSFPLVDCLCDLYNSTKKDSYLNMAMEIADYWIAARGKTGLFPKNSDGRESWFDSETDMTVAIYKLWEISGKEVYKEAADHCFEATIKYHGSRDYPLTVDIDTGEVVNDTQRTKYLALFLKLIILLIEYEKGAKIYKDKKLFDLLRDR